MHAAWKRKLFHALVLLFCGASPALGFIFKRRKRNVFLKYTAEIERVGIPDALRYFADVEV